MTKKKSPAKKPDPIQISEAAIRFTKALRVDREAGIVYGVKVLGWESDNGRVYTQECAQKAINAKLYENCKTYADHPDPDSKTARSVYDLTGKLFNAHILPDGVYADWQLNRKHELFESILDDAEQGTGFFGLSHNAEAAEWEIRDGKQVVLEIGKVFSVDMVSDPATVTSLSESTSKGTKPIAKIKILDLFESLTTSAKLPRGKRAKLLNMLENKALKEMGDMDMEAPPEETKPEDALKEGFETAISAFVAQALAGELDPKEALQKIKDLVMSHSKLNGNGDSGDGETPNEEVDEDRWSDGTGYNNEKEKRAMFARMRADGDLGGEGKKPVQPTLTEAKIKDLCELAGVELTTNLKEACLGCSNESAAIKVIKLAKGKPGDSKSNGKTVFAESAPSGIVTESKKAQKNGEYRFVTR